MERRVRCRPFFRDNRTTASSPSYNEFDCIPLPCNKNTQARRGDELKGSDHNSKFLLTNREREVFELLVQDKTTKDIAQQLFISEKTVRNHISNVMQKLNVKGRSQAVVELIKLGELKI
jgi:LuxR family transcriptional regulator of spore coat protein